jgi:hypothetical protein
MEASGQKRIAEAMPGSGRRLLPENPVPWEPGQNDISGPITPAPQYNRPMKPAVYVAIPVALCLGISLGFMAFAQSNDDPLDSLKICGDTQKLVFENKFVRVIDNQVPVGAVEPMHDHPHGVIVYLSGGKNEVTTQDGKKRISENKADTAVWSEPIVHSVKNIGDAPSHTIRIDIKY